MSGNNSSNLAVGRIMKEYKQLQQQAPENFWVEIVDDNLFKWEVRIFQLQDPYEEGIFRAILEFPQSYPLAPPTLKFITEMWHPNIYSDGKVCISILHSPGEDPLGYEQAAERWSPAQSVEKIMLSVISLLYTPDASSPANVDAALELRNDSKKYFKKVRRLARRTAPS